jgi:hypothetical protein
MRVGEPVVQSVADPTAGDCIADRMMLHAHRLR